MQFDNLPDHYVYTQETIEFVTVVAETCLFLEHSATLEKDDFISKSLKILPLLYLKAMLLKPNESEMEGYVEQFVSEDDYNYVSNQIKNLLEEDDAFLEVFHPDMNYSDTPIISFISENIADVYQEIKDLAGNYQSGETPVMNDAVVNCRETFAEHWGQKLLNATRALHNIKFKEQQA